MIEYFKSKKILEKENRVLRYTNDRLRNKVYLQDLRINKAMNYIINDMKHLKTNSKESRNTLLNILIGGDYGTKK